MTERLTTLLADLAETERLTVPSPDQVWRRAGRTRRRRRAAAAVVLTAVGASVLALATLPKSQVIGPARQPEGLLQPLPERLEPPYGEVPTIAESPTHRIQLLVTTKLFDRLFFVPRTRQTCGLSGACRDLTATLGVGSDHGYRYLVDPRRDGRQFMLAPDGRHAAMLEGSDIGRWRFLDLTAGAALPTVDCAGTAGWTRDGWFVCVPESGTSLMRYGINSGGGVTGTEIEWSTAVDATSARITPRLLGPDASALLVPGSAPRTLDVIDPSGRVTRTIPYPDGAVSASPLGWCGADAVLIDTDIGQIVVGLDGIDRFNGSKGWVVLGCRSDGSALVQDPTAFGVWLLNPNGQEIGHLTLPRGRSGLVGPSDIVGVAVDAFDWRMGGSPARVAGFRPIEWADEAALVVAVLGLVGWLARRRQRRRVLDRLTADLA